MRTTWTKYVSGQWHSITTTHYYKHTAPVACNTEQYIKDTFVVWPHEREEVERFYEHRNMDNTQTSSSLLEVKKDKPGLLKLTTRVYHRLTHRQCYIPLHSRHHPKTVTRMLRCMRDRANHICDSTSKTTELQHLKDVFQVNGFPSDLVRRTLTQ